MRAGNSLTERLLGDERNQARSECRQSYRQAGIRTGVDLDLEMQIDMHLYSDIDFIWIWKWIRCRC